MTLECLCPSCQAEDIPVLAWRGVPPVLQASCPTCGAGLGAVPESEALVAEEWAQWLARPWKPPEQRIPRREERERRSALLRSRRDEYLARLANGARYLEEALARFRAAGGDAPQGEWKAFEEARTGWFAMERLVRDVLGATGHVGGGQACEGGAPVVCEACATQASRYVEARREEPDANPEGVAPHVP